MVIQGEPFDGTRPLLVDACQNKYILDRLTQINDEIVNNDPEYRELMERVDEWKKKIAAKLPPEDDQLLEDHEGSWLA